MANQLAIDLFRIAEKSGHQVQGKERPLIYLRTVDCEALFRIYEVPLEDQPDLLSKLMILQDVANGLRPRYKKPKRVGRRRGMFRGF